RPHRGRPGRAPAAPHAGPAGHHARPDRRQPGRRRRRPQGRGRMIELDEVTKVYRMGSVEVEALKGVSLRVDEGEFIAIMGASGSGKSTLMNIIGCLDLPTSGRYLLDGVDVRGLNDDRLAAIRNLKIGFVFQSF